jgi:kumamolisin
MPPDDSSASRVALAGSERTSPLQGTDKGPVDPDEKAHVTVILRSRTPPQELHRLMQNASAQPLANREYMTREQLSAMRGAEPGDIEGVKQFAATHHLTVTQVDTGARSVSIEGTLKDLEQAFGVELRKYEAGGQMFRTRSGAIHLPSDIASAVEAVLGLDTRPAANPR